MPSTLRHARTTITAARWLIALAALAVTPTAQAEPPRLTAEVDRTDVAVGEPFIFQVTLSLADEEVESYRPPDFRNLKVLSAPRAPSRSTQMQIGAGGTFVQNSFIWQYQLLAADKGSYNIGPARVRIQGQEIRSNIVRVTARTHHGGGATPGAPSPLAGAGANTPGLPSPLDDQSNRAAAEGGTFVRLSVDKQKAFVGEAISATWLLYLGTPQDHYETVVEPRVEGFWSEDVATGQARPGSFTLTQELVNGRPYQVGTIMRKALFPLHPGTLQITPLEGKVSRSDFFGMSARTQRLRAEPMNIEVLPLPRAGQPAGFPVSNVGQFSLSARVDRDQVPVGEPVTLKLELSGRGNIRKVTLPDLPKLRGWKVYEPRVTTAIDPTDGIAGRKTAEILLVAEEAGTAVLPPLVLDYFDPEARRYARAETEPLSLTAAGQAPNVAGLNAGAAEGTAGNGDVPREPGGAAPATTASAAQMAEEIRPIHATPRLARDVGGTILRSRGFVPLVLAPPFAFALLLVSFQLRDRLGADTDQRRQRRTRRHLRARLRVAEQHLHRGEVAAFCAEIDRVLRDALAARFGAAVKGLSLEELELTLAARGLAADALRNLIAVLERCHEARFAAGTLAQADLTALLDDAQKLLDRIERGESGRDAPNAPERTTAT